MTCKTQCKPSHRNTFSQAFFDSKTSAVASAPGCFSSDLKKISFQRSDPDSNNTLIFFSFFNIRNLSPNWFPYNLSLFKCSDHSDST